MRIMNKKINDICAGAFLIVLALFLTGCATAPGDLYKGLQPIEPAMGDVYLYRTKALFAIGQGFSTTMQGETGGTLYNGSYLLFRLVPGSYDLAVKPGPFGITSHLTIEVKAGVRSFYQYDFPTGILANTFFIGSSIEPRTQQVAEEDLKDLAAAKLDLLAKTTVYSTTRFAAVKDVDAVPLSTAQGKSAYRLWLTKQPPRAFMIADSGRWVATWGENPLDPTESRDPTARAKERCVRNQLINCKMYAINNRVVWEAPAPAISNDQKQPDSVPPQAPVPEPALTQTPPPPPPAPVVQAAPATPKYSATSVTPIFSQLLKADYPEGFTTVTEQLTSVRYTREAVPAGEDAVRWTRKFTITGAKGLADDAAMTPSLFGEKIAQDLQATCPDSFSKKTLSEGEVNGYDQFIAALSCGAAVREKNTSGESTLLIVIKGEHDYYSVQSSERSAPSPTPPPINTAQWLNKRKNLGAIKLCTPVPGETPPYSSCTGF